MDFERSLVELSGEIIVLPANRLAEILLDQAGSQVECRLKFGHSAQKMNFAGGTPLFYIRAPFVEMPFEVLCIRTQLMMIRGQGHQILMMGCQSGYAAVQIRQGFQSGLNADHRGAIKIDLFPHVPVEGAGKHPLEALDELIFEPGRTRIYGADGRHLTLGGIASVHQRHQIGRDDAIESQGALRYSRARPLLDLLNGRG